jgi:hypothetical protein
MTDPNNIYNMNWVKYVPYTTGISKPVWLGGDTPTTGVRINTNTLDFKNYINFAGMTDANGVVSGVTMSLTFGQQDAEHNICAWTSCYTTSSSSSWLPAYDGPLSHSLTAYYSRQRWTNSVADSWSFVV